MSDYKTTMFEEDGLAENSSVIESAQIFSPLFSDKFTVAGIRKAAMSPSFKSLIDRADERVNGVAWSAAHPLPE